MTVPLLTASPLEEDIGLEEVLSFGRFDDEDADAPLPGLGVSAPFGWSPWNDFLVPIVTSHNKNQYPNRTVRMQVCSIYKDKLVAGRSSCPVADEGMQ